MIVGVRVFQFEIPGNESLKGKRSVVRSALERAAARFNVAIAEVGAQDEHRRALVGASVVSNTHAHASRMLEEIDTFLARAGAWHLISQRTEFFSMGLSPNTTMSDELKWSDFDDEAGDE